MKRALALLRQAAASFDADDNPDEPAYDPVHLGATLILTLITVGVLYWILWTLLVYEGGLFSKIVPALQLLLRRKTPAELGYRGPWDRGVFEGWAGNVGALLIAIVVVTSLQKLYKDASRARGR